MNKVINKLIAGAVLVCSLAILASCGGNKGRYSYETVPGDPMNVQTYKLKNGLTVAMTVNKEQPRIQTYIAVRTGSKNDPAETTGLAHYLEHLMFKGTSHYGTQNYEAEKPLLDTIVTLFENYRSLTDPAERKAAYHIIDSISGVASQYAIPNEYDKMMAMIGANGSNAFTSNDVTCYTEDIPSNQIENWAKIQSERFKDPIFRLFHTELEAVYEEKNMSMTRDMSKEFETLSALLFPTHPYGTQTTIGTQEHLKNPSLVNIQNYFNKWYVPGNVIISLSGDFEPNAMVDIIEKYFGDWNAKEGYTNTPDQLTFGPQPAITEPVGKEVLGQEAENVMLGWRFEGAKSDQMDTLNLITGLLSNGTAGLIDLDLNQQQKVLMAGLESDAMRDYTILIAYGMPLPGQPLDEVRQLLLTEIEKVANGDFDEELLASVLTEQKLNQQRGLENNDNRAMQMVNAFINGEDWAHAIQTLDREGKITKQDIMAFAKRHLTAQNYVYVNKLQGVDPNIQRIDKPEITPVQSNRDAKSEFLSAIATSETAPIEPVFVDYNKEVETNSTANGLTLLSKKNETNQLFELDYVYEMGSDADKTLPVVSEYSNYIGTSDMTPEQVQKAFYALGCTFSLACNNRRFYAEVSGLNENLEAAIKLVDKVLSDAQPNEEVFPALKQALLKARADSKLSQGANNSQLITYASYGPEYIKAHTLTNAELMGLTAKDLTDRIHDLLNLKHRVVYYGPSTAAEVSELIAANHKVAAELKDGPANKTYKMVPTETNVVFEAPYIANNTYLRQVCNLGNEYDATLEPLRNLYNEYFGGSMNAIVFQEMRETRGLAYNAWANFIRPSSKGQTYNMQAHIITQNDKLPEALKHFNEIIEEMPESEAAFQNAKTALIGRLRTERTTRSAVLWTYINQVQEFGLTEDPNKTLFEGVQNLTLQDLVKFQQQWVKGHHYNICVLGNPRQINQTCLKEMGTIKYLKPEDIFGY
jgi:predicted Zn-dependent peptidase